MRLFSKKERAKKSAVKNSDADSGDAAASSGATGGDENVTWFTDTSAEAQKARELQERRKMDADRALSTAAPAPKSVDATPTEILKTFLDRDRDLHEITSELRRLELSRNLDETAKMEVLLGALLDLEDIRTVPQQLQKVSSTLSSFAKSKHEKNVLLAALEHLAGVEHYALAPRMPLLLQSLYEQDIFDEDMLLLWHAAPPESSWAVDAEVASKLRGHAKPFIDWLNEADDDEDDDDDE